MSESLRTLIVEDRPSDAKLVVRELERAGFDPSWKRVETEENYVTQLKASPEVILADYTMPEFGAMRALAVLQEKALDIPFIIISGSIGEDIAVEAMRRGASDYLLKDRLGRLGPAVNNALQRNRSRKESKRAARELHSTHEQLRHLLAHSPAVIYSLQIEDQHVTTTVVSENIERLLGVPVEEATYDWWLESLHPDDRERVLHKLKGSLAGSGYSMEYRLRHKDGSYHWIEDNNRVVWDLFGDATEAVGVWTDVTARKQAEDARFKSDECMRSVLDSALDCIVTTDHQGRVIEFNPAAENTFGYDRRDAVGKLLADLIVPVSLRDMHGPGLSHYLVNGAPSVLGKRVELSAMRRDGSEFPVELAITRIGSQEPPMFTSFIRDITARKDSEDRLREQAALLDLAQDAIMVRDMSDCVEFWNHGAEQLYGWTAAEVHGKKASGFLYEHEPCTVAAARASIIENGKWTGECTHNCKSGDVVTVRSRWTLVRDELAAPKSILIINTDITEQKKVEAQFLRAQRMESIGTLASGVAHDLNNVLTPILMCAQMLRDDIKSESGTAKLTLIDRSAQRGAAIVKQVLTFARGIDGARVTTNPRHLIDEMVDIARKTFPKSIQVTARYPEELWTIQVDPTQLHQVLLNLCVNARDAMPNGGALTIGAENFNVDENYASMMPGAKPGRHVLFKVTDTGTGMPRGLIDKIFDPFFTTKELGKGTGLGLSTSLGIVKSHGGLISVYSELGRGTTFKIFVPTVDGPTEPVEPLALDLIHGNNETVLLVDDEESVRRVTRLVLEKHSYRVIEATDGPEAVATFAKHVGSINIVLTDMMLPYMDGIAVIRAIRTMKADTVFIASTGQVDDVRVSELQSLGVTNILSKPYDTATLLRSLGTAITPA